MYACVRFVHTSGLGWLYCDTLTAEPSVSYIYSDPHGSSSLPLQSIMLVCLELF